MGSAQFTGHSYSAAATETVNAYCFVSSATSAYNDLKVEQADSGEKPVGIASDTVSTSGRYVSIFIDGIGKLKVDGSGTSIAAGDPLKPDNSGRGVKAGTDKDVYGAIALEPSTAANDIITVMIVPPTTLSV